MLEIELEKLKSELAELKKANEEKDIPTPDPSDKMADEEKESTSPVPIEEPKEEKPELEQTSPSPVTEEEAKD